ncbi:MAG: leucine-rich repeat domain-containing protein, partial [Kiritimatiellae bacterium]|nr:leucine-rich repeat domain-containing protein [Kiritimatiellia bacterium]
MTKNKWKTFLCASWLMLCTFSGFCGEYFQDGITWQYSENGTVTGYSPKDVTELVIPAQMNGKTVTSIGYRAFYGCSGLTSVTIPDTVTYIGVAAFYGCSGLTSVTIPDSVTSIGFLAFLGCSGVTSVHITDLKKWCGSIISSVGLTNPHDLYINGNKVLDLTIPDSVTSIASEAFSGCRGLTSVTIPNSVTNIGNQAFYNCANLTNLTIGASVVRIGDSAFYRCERLVGALTIP